MLFGLWCGSEPGLLSESVVAREVENESESAGEDDSNLRGMEDRHDKGPMFIMKERKERERRERERSKYIKLET